jgi:flagellar biogenesis protein FliO
LLRRAWNAFCSRGIAGIFQNAARRRLRLAETLPLGERRFVAVVEFEGQRFLLGGTSAQITLLSRLPEGDPQACAGAGRGCSGEEERQ